jgi:predicted permease
MDSFLMAARVVVPMAMMMAVGVLMRTDKITDRPTMKKVDQIVSKVCMPLLMFKNIYTTDFAQFNGAGYLLYGAAGLVALFLFGVFVLPKIMREPPRAAAMGQALLRPNYILFGSAVAESIYGEGNIGIVMLMGAFAVPFFNALAVILLEIGRNSTASPAKLLKSICKNAIVQAAVIALVLKLLSLQIPAMAEDVAFDLAGMATPLSFLSLGVSLDISAIGRNRKPLVLGIATRLVLIPLIFVTAAIALGFRGPELCAIFLLFAAPTAVSSYPLAVSMDADPELAGQMVIFTTVCCLPTFFLWVMAMSSFGLF